jgi:type II secretory pathway pseudopilin PulG
VSRAAERGVTLLEAVVALTIVALAGVAALATVGAELRGAQRSRQAIKASSLAEDRMLQVTLLPVAALDALPDSVRHGDFPDALSGYHWETTAHTVPDEADTYELGVTISWADRGQYTLRTRVYRPRPLGIGGHLSAFGGAP